MHASRLLYSIILFIMSGMLCVVLSLGALWLHAMCNVGRGGVWWCSCPDAVFRCGTTSKALIVVLLQAKETANKAGDHASDMAGKTQDHASSMADKAGSKVCMGFGTLW